MYKKFCIVFFVVVFCNGVTYSSPTKENAPEPTSNSKEKPAVSSEVNIQVNHTVQPSTPAPDNGTHHVQTPAVQTGSNHTAVGDKIIHANSSGAEKTVSHVSDNKIATQNTSTTVGDLPGAPPKDSKQATPTPASNNNTSTDLPLSNYSDMSRPITGKQPAAIIPTTAAAATTTTTTTTTAKAPDTKPTAATPTPTPTPAFSTATDDPMLEHNSAQKAQENRFDGASFVGGIVLTIGLTAIGFIAFKYYKSGKIDANYRTL